MATTLHRFKDPLRKRIQKFWTSIPESNIPLIRYTSKITLFSCMLPFEFGTTKFHLCKSKWRSFLRKLAILTSVVHSLMALNWFHDYYFGDMKHTTANWKGVMMGFIQIVFGLAIIFMFHFAWFRNEVVLLLNYSIQIEKDCANRGAQNYVHGYFVIIQILAQINVVLMTVSLAVMNLIRPCMPPAVINVLILSCQSWDDTGGAGLLLRFVIGIEVGYATAVVASLISFSVGVLLVYPVQVVLLAIKTLEREVVTGREESAVKYRRVQILMGLFNDVWQKPVMPLLVSGMTLFEALSLYILITSVKDVPIPIVAIFADAAVDQAIVIHVIFNILSYPVEASLEFLDKLRGRRLAGKTPVEVSNWAGRFAKSCPLAKVSMGDGTFFDRLTSFVIWKSTMDMLITFLLM